ncbi:hypothetical protein BS47DRAFT_1398893 [Hydnum rufescens UP504]|uniref:Secreted protein n=1 Tax=Hydnum rufescens UP504 TaxID=1448309 RepID=A0A9P6DQ82_9AGAM|nr:hypothetical protein BS47DRAFT_1398893 [Hydnum rufescens UP504]
MVFLWFFTLVAVSKCVSTNFKVHDERLSCAEELTTRLHKPTSSSRSKGRTVNTCLPSSNQPSPLSIPSSSLVKFPKFTKKDLSSVLLEESHGPLLWQLHQPLAPLPPDAIKNLKSSAAGMCSRYIHHFLVKIKGVCFLHRLYCL